VSGGFAGLRNRLRIGTLWLFVGTVPQSLWYPLLRLVACLRTRRSRAAHLAPARRALEACWQALEWAPLDPVAMERAVEQAAYRQREELLFTLKSAWPAGWHPELELEGSEHLQAALAGGRGVVLWVALQNYRLPWKMTLHAHGVAAVHLNPSEPPRARFDSGLTRLDRIRAQVEARYLAARISVTESGVRGAARALTAALARNQIVAVTDAGNCPPTLTVPFLAGTRRVFVHAPRLAIANGAPLLPLYTIRRSENAYLVRIGAPLNAPDGLDRHPRIAHMTRAFVADMEDLVRRHPAVWDWQRWSPKP
jgi:KDO2-lipid IV(A) lauroyltransferase